MAIENFNFTPDFEDLVLSSFIAHPNDFTKFGPILDFKYFTSSTSLIAARATFNYYQAYNHIPSWEVLGQLVEDEIKKTAASTQDGREYVAKLRAIDTSHTGYVTERIILFCKERATLAAIRKSIKLIKEGGVPEAGFANLFENISSIGQNLDDFGYLLHSDVDRVVDKLTSTTIGVKTGIQQFDKIWRQGWGAGWLIVPLAPPKRYKSTYCLNIALSVAGPAVAQDVLYYSCEISSELTLQRAFFNLSGLKEDNLFIEPEKFKQDVKAKISEMVCGNLLVKHYPIGTAKISDLKAHARLVKKQWNLNPKLIVIDYADTVLPSDPSIRPDLQQAAIYKEAIAFGAEFGAAVLMPDRCTKDAVDKKVPNLKSFQGAYSKAGIVDVAIGLCATDDEYQANILRSFIFINRHGRSWQHFKGKVDPERALIDIGDEIAYIPEEEGEEKKSYRRRSSDDGVPPELV